MSKTLIVYYSRKGENYVNGSIRNLSKGNTEVIAEMIADLTGGDLFEVETVKTYPADYYACIDEAKAELRQGARPELKAYPDSLDGYDTIFVGYPNWWSDAPMAVYTFLESYDWTGKTLIPFNTSASGGFGRSLDNLAGSAAGATILEGLSFTERTLGDAQSEVPAWLDGLGLS